MEDILKDLNASIEKNLPAQIGEVLRKRLQQAEIDAKKVTSLTEDVKYYQETLDAVNKKLVSQQELERKEENVAAKLLDLDTRERNIKIQILETQLTEANKRADISKELVTLVFKNPTYKTTEFNSINKNVPYNTSGYTQYNNESTSESKTTTKETD